MYALRNFVLPISGDFREEEGYFLPTEEIVRGAQESQKRYGGVHTGLLPKMHGISTSDICKAVKKELPDIHLHAFSPEEVMYGAVINATPVPQ